MKQNPIICAIDTTDVAAAATLAESLRGQVAACKLGLEFFTANGAAGVAKIASPQSPIFLDLKFHDIPNTVEGAVRAAAKLDVFMLTVHAAGGRAMMQAAQRAAKDSANALNKMPPKLVAVTMLTSMEQADLSDTGIVATMNQHVLRLAELAAESGLDGVVCSPLEVAMLRKELGPNFTLVVPGIRPAGDAKGDQKRVMTPRDAMDAGASYLVIGRPITIAKNPAEAAASILQSLA